MILPEGLSRERIEWIRAAGDAGRKLRVGPVWDAQSDPPKLRTGVSPVAGGVLSSSEIVRVTERITAPLPPT